MPTIDLAPEQLSYLRQLLRNEILAGQNAEDVYRKLSDEDRDREAYYAVANAKDSSLMAQRILRDLAHV